MKKITTITLAILSIGFTVKAQDLSGTFKQDQYDRGYGVVGYKKITLNSNGSGTWIWKSDHSNSTIKTTQNAGGKTEEHRYKIKWNKTENGISFSCVKHNLYLNGRFEKERGCFLSNKTMTIVDGGLKMAGNDYGGIYKGGNLHQSGRGANRNGNKEDSEMSRSTIDPSNFHKKPKDLKESFIKEFNPQGYGYYQYGMTVADRGKGIAEQIANQLDNYSTIINNSDPAKVVQEFESKMAALDNMEGQLEQEQSDLVMNQLDELGDQINAKDYQGIQSNVFGSLSALAEMGDAKAELKRQKEQLEKERQQKNQQAFQVKYKATEPLILEFKKRAAFAENKTDEQYYLDYVDHLLASVTSNDYASPTKPTDDNSIENKFITKDVQWANKAKYKLSKYIYDNAMSGLDAFMIIDGEDISTTSASKYIPEAYLEAAISYASKAALKNPTAKNYMFLAELYTLKRDFTAYTMFLTAKKMDSIYVENYTTQLREAINKGADKSIYTLKHSDNPNYNTEQMISSMQTGLKEVTMEMHQEKLKNIKDNAEGQIKNAIRLNNREALNALLELNLDQSIKIDNKDLLTYAVETDQPDATQLILNKYIDELSEKEKNTKLQKTIMLAVTYDSPKVLSRFVKLGVSMDFTLKNYTPKSLANELGSEKAMEVLQGKNIDYSLTQPKSLFSEQQRQDALAHLEKMKEKQREGKTEEELNKEGLEYIKNYVLTYRNLPTSQLLSLNTGMKELNKIHTENGGTVLHLLINLTLQNNLDFCRSLVITLSKNEMDFTLKDKNGKTAYGLLLEHEKELKKISKKVHNYRSGSAKYCWEERIKNFKP